MLDDKDCSPLVNAKSAQAPIFGAQAVALNSDVETIREKIERENELRRRRFAARIVDAEHAAISARERRRVAAENHRAAEAERRALGLPPVPSKPVLSEHDRIAAIVGPSTGLRQAFTDLIPARPYCGDYLENGLTIRRKSIAIGKRHLQLNTPSAFQWMPDDIDRADAYFAHRDANLPPPNVIMINRENGHGHAAYLLKTPVARHDAARIAPLRYFAAVERGVTRRLEADCQYSGLIVKNPLHTDWLVEWRRQEPYSLEEIADNLFPKEMQWEAIPHTAFGAGRNVTVFDELRAIAYREVRRYKRDGLAFDAWKARCLKLAIGINLQFPEAMQIAEVRAIAKSVAKWTWRHFSVERFSAIQSARSQRGNEKRWAGHVSAEKTMPWLALGISRRTYYNRKASSAAV